MEMFLKGELVFAKKFETAGGKEYWKLQMESMGDYGKKVTDITDWEPKAHYAAGDVPMLPVRHGIKDGKINFTVVTKEDGNGNGASAAGDVKRGVKI